MVDMSFDHPIIDPSRPPEESISQITQWIEDTASRLDLLVAKVNRELEEINGN